MTQRTKSTKWVQLDLYDVYAYERVKEKTQCDRSSENPSTKDAAPSDSKTKPGEPKQQTPR